MSGPSRYQYRLLEYRTLLRVLFLASTLFITRYALASAQGAVQVTITTAETTIIEGAESRWQVTIELGTTAEVTELELVSGDPSVWFIRVDATPPTNVNSTQVMDVTAVALRSGILRPALRVTYRVNGETQSRTVTGQEPIQVVSVGSLNKVDLTPHPGTTGSGDTTPLIISIDNRSPFTLSEVVFEDFSTNTVLTGLSPLNDVLPGAFMTREVTAKVHGTGAVARVNTRYTWQDAAQRQKDHREFIENPLVAPPGRVLGLFSNEIWAIIVGVVVGALATVIPNMVDRHMARQNQKDNEHTLVFSLLNWGAKQTKWISEGEQYDLSPLNKVFETTGLAAVLDKEGLSRITFDLLTSANAYNRSLNTPNLTHQRWQSLNETARRLENQIDAIQRGNNNTKK